MKKFASYAAATGMAVLYALLIVYAVLIVLPILGVGRHLSALAAILTFNPINIHVEVAQVRDFWIEQVGTLREAPGEVIALWRERAAI